MLDDAGLKILLQKKLPYVVHARRFDLRWRKGTCEGDGGQEQPLATGGAGVQEGPGRRSADRVRQRRDVGGHSARHQGPTSSNTTLDGG